MAVFQMKIAILLAVIVVAACNSCKYAKFSPIHSYCLPPSSSCNLLDTTVTAEDKALILRLHNEYRQKIATGQETHLGGFPPASNMMEMVWDDELAAVAQGHANQCVYEHDCHPCRRVDRFLPGQSIYRGRSYSMPKDDYWEKMIKKAYDEISIFPKKEISSFVGKGGYGHFTQLVWATSWLIGCGRAVYKEGEIYNTFLVCDYGPGGNVPGVEIYKAGPACSNCPKGTCCSSSCDKSGIHSDYQGLCKVIDVNTFNIDDAVDENEDEYGDENGGDYGDDNGGEYGDDNSDENDDEYGDDNDDKNDDEYGDDNSDENDDEYGDEYE